MQCNICGKEMFTSFTNGDNICSECKSSHNNSYTYVPNNCDIPVPQGFGKQEGWICPVCGRGLSPWVDVCPCMRNQEITYDTNVGFGDVTYDIAHLENKQPTAKDLDPRYNILGSKL